MKVTALQMSIRWTDVKSNAITARKLISNASASDLYVLPEMWGTGFITDPHNMDGEGADALEWMQTMATEHDAAVCGSLPIHDQGKYYNRHFFIKPDGSRCYYDKHHLFSHGGEDRFYQSGTRRTVAEWRGWRFLLLTCYDLRFPMWCRCQEDYDAAIVVANWPEQRTDAWDILTKARAIENQCFLVGCNRVGDDPSNHYIGRSVILTPEGKELDKGADDQEVAITSNLSLDVLRHSREHFTALKERDQILLNRN